VPHETSTSNRAVILALQFLALLAIVISAATNADSVLAQDTFETQVYSLPDSWQGNATVSLSELAGAAPPLQVIDATGDFRISRLPVDGDNVIRILPDPQSPGTSLTLAWPITADTDDVLLTPGTVLELSTSARTFSRPDGVLLTIREYDGDSWSSSSITMQDIAWKDYSVVRQLGEDTVEAQVGLHWTLPDENAWLELRNMQLAVLSEDDATRVQLSPTDTPAPSVTPTAETAQPAEGNTPDEEAPADDVLIVVTSTPTPPDIFAAATLVAQATEDAQSVGTATPTPQNMVTATPTPTAIRVTTTPTPASEATAQYLAAYATAMAATTGTPTPLPADARIVVLPTPTHTPKPSTNVRATPAPTATRTPTAVAVPYDELIFPSPTPTTEFPEELVGKILFLSDHLASNPRRPNAFMINPDGTGLALMNNRELYNRAKARDAYSADKRFYAYSLREPLGGRDGLIQVYYDDYEYDSYGHQLTYFGTGTAWAPAISPSHSEMVALVSSESANDEIWLAHRGRWPPMQLTKNDWEWDRSPSFSPTGTEIVFESNRVTGTRQLWIMDVSGLNQRQITNFPFETWDPVWVKYTDD
jgi:hypothetical protein